MKPSRDFIVANSTALIVILGALLLGWYEAAAFGLAVLVILDLLVLIRERGARSEIEKSDDVDQNNA